MPCPPTNVTAAHACAPSPVPVTWVASQGTKYYTAVAVSGGGHRSECTTNKTSCSLAGLQCGEVYTIGVSSADDDCAGQQSDTVSLKTGRTTRKTTQKYLASSYRCFISSCFPSAEPCSPLNVSSRLICRTNSAQVSWAASANALTYTATAASAGQTLSCSSPSTNCTLKNLACGEPYDIVVTASDGVCVSNHSAPFRQDPGTACWFFKRYPKHKHLKTEPTFRTNAKLELFFYFFSIVFWKYLSKSRLISSLLVPCAPTNVSTNLLCGTNELVVGWNASVPLNYSVTVVPLAGNFSSLTCDSSHATCRLSGLRCGQTYNVSVKASSANCSGPSSHPHTVRTGTKKF